MCGIAVLYTNNNNQDLIYNIILNLQHRGQDSYGYSDGKNVEKYLGLIKRKPSRLKPPIFMAHTRYRTSGNIDDETCQPFVKNDIALIHNGTIQNLKGNNDSYSFLSLLSEKLKYRKNIIEVLKEFIETLTGGFFIIFSFQNKIYAFKDKHGIRPGVMGKTEDGSIILASENNFFEKLKITHIDDIGPGEIVVIEKDSIIRRKTNYIIKPCIFEYIYLAHPNSFIYGKGVKEFREDLAKSFINLLPKNINIDAVCCIPNSAKIYAQMIAKCLNKPYIEPMSQNKRSFIMPNKLSREEYLKQKFVFMEKELIDKDILLIDDSIVRGSTAKFIIETIKKINQGKIYFLSCAPKVVNVNLYGININKKEELVSFQRTHEEIEKYLGCDKLFYQTIDNLYNCSGFKNLEISIFN